MKLLLALLAFQAFYTPPATNEPIKDYSGQYVLITREWRSCEHQHGDSVSFDPCWDYTESYYPTLKDAENELTKDDCRLMLNQDSKEQPCIGQAQIEGTNFVGIYKLVPVLTRAQAHFTEGDKEIPAHVEVHKQHWSKWTIDGAKP
jgi:hypothetical protein